MANAIKFRHTDVPRHPGERARLKVVKGPDFGSVYIITGLQATIGRGEDSDIVLSDLKASRLHAAMSLDASGKWRIKDHGSANGILYNSQVVREAELKFNDVITFGETTLEFVSAEMGTQILMAPARSSAAVEAGQKALQAARNRVSQSYGRFSGGGGGANSAGSPDGVPVGSGGAKGKVLLYVVGALGLGLLFLGDPEKPVKSKSKLNNKDSGAMQDLASFLPAPEFNKTAETLFKDGLREYFVHNFGRARTQFETVLQISPNHVLATLYLENCNKAVEEEVKMNLEGGKKSFEAGKFRDAKGHFETVLRLLFRDQANPGYIEAKEQFDKLVKAIKGEEGKT